MLKRPVGMVDGPWGEERLLSALACEMQAGADAQEMVQDLLSELREAERKIARLKRRVRELHLSVHQLEWDAIPTDEDVEGAWMQESFLDIGMTAYALWKADETAEHLFSSVGKLVRLIDGEPPEAAGWRISDAVEKLRDER